MVWVKHTICNQPYDKKIVTALNKTTFLLILIGVSVLIAMKKKNTHASSNLGTDTKFPKLSAFIVC